MGSSTLGMGSVARQMTEPDGEIRDVSSGEIDRLSLVQKDQITAGEMKVSPTVSVTQTKGLIRLKLDFGGGSHWTMIYDPDERPIGCEYRKVCLRRRGEKIRVYSEG